MANGRPNEQPVAKIVTLCLLICYLYNYLCAAQDDYVDYLLCRHCGHEVTSADQMLTVPSKESLRQRNDTILGVNGVLIQLFQNPSGAQFEVITAKEADVFKHDRATSVFSWFPGFTWQMTVCPRCGFHLGWFFQPEGHDHSTKEEHEDSFVGLILSNLLHKDYADSLLITPKSYRSYGS